MNYNNRKFKVKESSENSGTSAETVYLYKQQGNILTSSYKGGEILSGQLIGLVDEQ